MAGARVEMFGGALFETAPSPNDFPNFVASTNKFSTRSHTPITTGTSVLGIVFDGGVAIAADTLGSYGSLARYREVDRVMTVNDNTILGAGGDYADFQFLREIIEEKVIEEECADDGFNLKPKSLHCWLTRVLYNRRSKFDPLWNTYVVGGLQDGEPYLGFVDQIGTAFVDKHIATGFGGHLALPMLRDALEKKPVLTEIEAKTLLTNCLRVLYYRDARSFYKYKIGIVTKDKSVIEGPLVLDSNWAVANANCGFE